ncbi:unnamed protein product [Symbiodinium microadriaticum]|nr:unnamed protein product [Symbiodinium microadriaticum]
MFRPSSSCVLRITMSKFTTRLSSIEAGCNEWLKKPFNKEELLARLSLAMRVAEEVASNGLCPGLSSVCSEDIRGVAMHTPEMQKRRSSASRLSVPSSRLGRPSLESNDLNVAPRSVSSGLVLPMPECEEEEQQHSSSDSSDEPGGSIAKSSTHEPGSALAAACRSGTAQEEDERGSSGDFSLRKPSGTSVQQLVCGEVIEPQRCPNAAVLTASLQAQDITEDVLTEQCRIDEFTCEQYINRQGVDDVESDVFMDAMGFLAELGASFVAISGLQGTPGHEIQLVRFALAMRDRLDELRKALSSAGEVSQLSLAIGLDMGKATRLVLGRLSPHVTITGPAMRKARLLCDEAGIQTSRQGFTQIFVSHLVLRRIGAVLSTLPIKPVDVHTGMPAVQTLPHEESSQIFALLQPNEEFTGTSKQSAASAAPVSSSRVSFDVQSDGYATTPSSPSGPPRTKGPTLPIPAQHASAGAYHAQEVQSRLGQGLGSQVIDEEFGIAVSTASAIRVLRGVEAEVSAWQSLALLCQVDAE